jgi:hypothetical protein
MVRAAWGRLIPWVLVTVLGFLALSILMMYRTRLEGFAVPSKPAPSALPPLPPVNQHIIASFTDMISKITKLQNDLVNAIPDILGVKANVCNIQEGIQNDYVGVKTPPPSQAELSATPDRQKVYATNRLATGQQAWQLTVTGYVFSNRQQLLDCSAPVVDLSGANPAPPTTEGFFAPPSEIPEIVNLTEKLEKAVSMFKTYSQTQEVGTWLDTIGKVENTNQFLSGLLNTAIKNYEGFADISGVYSNPTYTYPVPYKSYQINKSQDASYRTISAAYDVYTGFIKRVGDKYQQAKYTAGALANKYNNYNNAKNKDKDKPPKFD